MRRVQRSELEEETAEVEVLRAQAKRHEDIGKRIKAALGRANDIGSSLQASVGGQSYLDTQRLQTENQNIDYVLHAINKIQSPLEGKEEEEKVIRSGPANVGIQNYLASLRRVELRYAEISGSEVKMNREAARELYQLLSFGGRKLQEMFEGILQAEPERVEPLPYLSRDKDFPRLDQGKLSQLAELASFIATVQRGGQKEGPNAARVFTEIRGRYLHGTLSTLASATLTTSRRQNTEEIYRQGTCVIGTYARGISESFMVEFAHIRSIFGNIEIARVFEETTARALSEFARTLREINSQIKANMNTDCFLAYEILGVVNNLAFDMDQKTGFLKQQIFDAVKPIRDTAKVSLSELLEDVRRRVASVSFLPMDGASLPFTSEVMSRLQALTAYPQPLASIMASVGDGNWTTPGGNNSSTSLPTMKSFDGGPDPTSLIAHYVLDTLEALFSNLESKSRSVFRLKATTGVFLANNVAVAERMIRQSDLQPYLSSSNQQQSKLEIWRKKGTAAYLESWREPCAALMEVQYTNRGGRPPSGSGGPSADSAAVIKSLSSKERDSIKEKFKTFNGLFESLSARHREMLPSMEREVRSGLVRDIQAMIEPLYGRFWDKYHEIDKGKGKYVRYDKAGLSGQLAALA